MRFYSSIQERYSSHGPASDWCRAFVAERFGVNNVLLTTSGTSALELALMTAKLPVGGVVILPAFTFVSTFNAVKRCGFIPRVIDVDSNDLNLSLDELRKSICKQTCCVITVNYGGWSGDLRQIREICDQYNLVMIEDAAQSFDARFDGSLLGTFGDFAAFSFHHTKNIQCGEGGMLLCKESDAVERAEVLLEKGTSKLRYLRGDIKQYEWIDVGSSFVIGEPCAEVLKESLKSADETLIARQLLFEKYSSMPWESIDGVQALNLLPRCKPNGHIFGLLLSDKFLRSTNSKAWISEYMRPHYKSLSISPVGRPFSYRCPVAEDAGRHWFRAPINEEVGINSIETIFEKLAS